MHLVPGGPHVDRANRVCSHCGSHAIADMVHECSALQRLRQQYATLFTPMCLSDTDVTVFCMMQQNTYFVLGVCALACAVGMLFVY